MFEHCTWINEPSQWQMQESILRVVTDAKTDFWRQTYHGIARHSGHLFGFETSGDFTSVLRVSGKYQEKYDQAGIMVWIDEQNWVKAGIEFSDGKAALSSVVTLGASDWALSIFEGNPDDFWVRVTAGNGVLKLQASSDGQIWPMMRVCPFPRASTYIVGPMCCTPERQGLEVSFSEFEVGQPTDKELHDLS
jgi:regulation of enolase protein 1 (concanavalin A-like superfamily)